MTDVSPSDDELVSSYLDHEAAPEEVARVEGDPALMARVEEMRAAISFVAAPPPLPETDLDRIRATAVASFTPVTASPVVDMAAARAKRLERRNRILAVAAAVVLFGGLIGGIGALGGSSDDDTAGDATDAGADDGASVDSGTDDSGDDAALDAMSGSTNDDADMASAEMAPEADGDMADDMADESAVADDSGDVAEEAAAATRFMKSQSFDPLPDDLGRHASAAELAAVVEMLVIEMIIDEESDFAPGEFLPFSTCEETLAVALAGEEALDVDSVEAMVNATIYTVVVGRHVNTGELVGRLAPSATCSPATELFISP